MNCELMLTYDTPALRQTGSRNLTGQKTLPTIWGTYMKLVTKYQISASIVAEKNATKNGHIQNVCSMCIKRRFKCEKLTDGRTTDAYP